MSAVGVGLTVALLALGLSVGGVQDPALPLTVDSVALSRLTGKWHEVSRFGSWSTRECMEDTVVEYEPGRHGQLGVRLTCVAGSGSVAVSGAVKPGGPGGRFRIRLGYRLLSWMPASWSDHWLIEMDEAGRWCLIGDRHRDRLAVLSRTMALDESLLALAVAAARAQGFDVGRLVTVPQGPGSLIR